MIYIYIYIHTRTQCAVRGLLLFLVLVWGGLTYRRMDHHVCFFVFFYCVAVAARLCPHCSHVRLFMAPCIHFPPYSTFRAMLELYCERAELADGMSIVDLGCGWGSLSIFMASKYPKSKITSISNSKSQKAFIDGRCRDLGITNINVITGDIDVYDLPNHGVYDRVCSIEMFEVCDRRTLVFMLQ